MKIPSSVLNLVNVAAEDSTRYAIAGVQICRSGDECVARVTDGRRLVELRVPLYGTDKEEDWEAVAPAHLIQIARSWKASKVDVCLKGKQIRFAAYAGARLTAEDVPVDGNFPDTKGIVPEYAEDEAVTVGLSPVLLKGLIETLSSILEAWPVSGEEGVRMTIPKDAKRPIVFRSSCEAGSVVAVIMPANVPAPGES